MAGYTSRIRVEGETGYATPTRNVTVPLWVCVCVCVCVFVMCVFWLITRISQLYCSTDPLWSALQTLSPFHLSSLHPFCSLLFLLSLSAPKSTSDLSLFICSSHRSLSLTLFVCVCVCVCVAGVCMCLVCLCRVCVFIFNCVCVKSVSLSLTVRVALWMCQGVCVRVCVSAHSGNKGTVHDVPCGGFKYSDAQGS